MIIPSTINAIRGDLTSFEVSGIKGVLTASESNLYITDLTVEQNGTTAVVYFKVTAITIGNTGNITLTDTYDNEGVEATDTEVATVTFVTSDLTGVLPHESLSEDNVFDRQQQLADNQKAILDNQIAIANRLATVKLLMFTQLGTQLVSIVSTLATVVESVNLLMGDVNEVEQITRDTEVLVTKVAAMGSKPTIRG